MDSSWVTIVFDFLHAERSWLFSGLGLTLLAAFCFVFRWLLSLIFTDADIEQAKQLEAFKRQVDNRFEVLTAWIQILHREYTTENKGNPFGFHEQAAKFSHSSRDDAHQNKPNLKSLDVLSLDTNTWGQGADQMKAVDLSTDTIQSRHMRVKRAKTVLLRVGLAFAILAVLVVSLAFI